METLAIAGLAWAKDGHVCVQQVGSDFDLVAALQPWTGKKVKLLLCFNPPQPVNPKAWGLGCCHWQPDGECPAGHKQDPGKMLLFAADGIIGWQDGHLGVDTDKGFKVLPLNQIVGHDIRFMLVEQIDLEGLKSSSPDQIHLLVNELGKMQEFLSTMLKAGFPK